MKKKSDSSNEPELSLDDSLTEIINTKKNENSALKKIVNALVNDSIKDHTNKKQ